jgi:hypothetical protein
MADFTFSAKRLAEVAEHATKLTAGVLAAFYVLGLIAVNLYLANFGFAAFSYARPQYIFTGAWIVLLFVVTMLPAAGASYLLFRDRRSFRAARQSFAALRIHLLPIIRLLISVGALLLISPALWYVFFRATSDKWQMPPVGGAILILICCAFGCVSFLALAISTRAASGQNGAAEIIGTPERSDKAISDAAMLLAAAIVTMVLLFFLSIFSSTTYRVIDPAYGGGRPVRARVIVDAGATSDLMQIDFPLRRGMNVSLPVDIMAESEDEIFIATDIHEFRLRKPLFKAAILKPFSDDLGWEFKDIDELVKHPDQVQSEPDCQQSFSDAVQSVLETADLPQRRSADLTWRCESTCYSTAAILEKIRAEQERCADKAAKAHAPAQPK